MEICNLPTKSLYKNPDNFFRPLSKKEYEELKGSIRRHGILEPLIVTRTGNGYYMVLAGNHRYDIARELGIEFLNCVILDKEEIEGAFDTEIYRRHLSEEEKQKSIEIKEKKCKEIIDKVMEEKLISNFYESYKSGEIHINLAIQLAKLPYEHQLALYQGYIKRIEEVSMTEEISYYKKELEEKEKELKERELELEKLKKWKNEMKEKLESSIDKYEGMKEKVEAKVRKEFEQNIKNLENVNENLRLQIRKKEEDIKKLEEEIESIKRKQSVPMIEYKAKIIEELENRRKDLVNIIVIHLMNGFDNLKKAKNHLKGPLNKRDFQEASNLLKNIIEISNEMIKDLKVKSRDEDIEE
jgi:ParB family chromosome partitioning protein